MNKTIGIAIGILVILGISFFAFSSSQPDKEPTKNEISETQKEVTEKEDAMPTKTSGETEEDEEFDDLIGGSTLTTKAGSYESYNASKIALAETGKVVLFFHASWCPSCKALNTDIEENIDNIPAKTTILKTDYDKETELKKKYGVTTQHTLVQVDKDGNLIEKWSGGSTLDSILSKIN